jgi:hypothetical protein
MCDSADDRRKRQLIKQRACDAGIGGDVCAIG